MKDKLTEDLGMTFRLERTQRGPGKDRAHVEPVAGPDAPSGVGLDRAADRLLTALGAVVLDIREHVHATLPRPEDKDFSILKATINGDKRSDAPAGRVALDAAGGANEKKELRVKMREGFIGHVTGLEVRSTDPIFDAKGLKVTFTLRGAALTISRVRFARPHVLELDDEIVILIENLTAAPVTVEYAVLGWLRREG